MSYRNKKQKIDVFLALLILAMAGFGLIMISSASVVLSYEKFGHNYHYLTKQFEYLLVGIIGMIFMAMFDYRHLKKNALWFLIGSLGLLLLVLIPGVGSNLKGASRWVHIGPIFFQPSEFAKLGFVIYLAAWLDKKGILIKSFKAGFAPFFALVGVLIFLILKQPDMGTAIVFITTAVTVFFIAGADISQLVVGTTSVAVALSALIVSSPYRLNRLKVFLSPESHSVLGIGYHAYQALLAIGSGGILGLGFGQSKQKYLYLPEPFSDSIFAISVEELGFVRAAFIIVAFLLLAWRGFNVAKRAQDDFGKYLAAGITSWFVFQAFLNISAMLGVVPLTGVPLPFISAGGSSLVISLIAVGILLNVSKQSRSANYERI